MGVLVSQLNKLKKKIMVDVDIKTAMIGLCKYGFCGFCVIDGCWPTMFTIGCYPTTNLLPSTLRISGSNKPTFPLIAS
ncbi:MAG: hypothetical protein ABI337_01120, partial [Nitrososphaera sp.]